MLWRVVLPGDSERALIRVTDRAGVEHRILVLSRTEADRAIEKLKSDASLDEVALKPTNSYYRRIQHQQIVDAGFHSYSVGEGPDRAVKVSRKEVDE